MKDFTDDMLWLQKWFESQCDGDWEHEYGKWVICNPITKRKHSIDQLN